MEDYVKDASLASNDEGLLRSYDKEQAYKDECYKEGLDEGIIKTAKKMLEKNIDLNTISDCTDLSIEELEKLKD